MIDCPDERVCVAVVEGPLRLEDLLFQAKKASRLAPVQVVREDRGVGLDHLRTAAAHMWRAMEEGRNQANRPEVEFTRYLAGRRTIQEALTHMGIEDGAPRGVVVGLGDDREKAWSTSSRCSASSKAHCPTPTRPMRARSASRTTHGRRRRVSVASTCPWRRWPAST